jgi:hypothetical protein
LTAPPAGREWTGARNLLELVTGSMPHIRRGRLFAPRVLSLAHLVLWLLASLLVSACGGRATDTLADDDSEPSEPDLPTPLERCEASCDRQADYCAALEREGCSRVCEFVVNEFAGDAACTELAVQRWECDVTVAWVCSPLTNVLAQRLRPSDCSAEDNAFLSAGCEVPSFD